MAQVIHGLGDYQKMGGHCRGRLLTRNIEVAFQGGKLISCPLSEAKKGVVEWGGKWKF